MFGRLLRVLLGFAVACFGAGLTMVLFVMTPGEIAGLPPDVAGDRLSKGFELATFVAVQAALFSAPFALVAAAVGEALRNREWTYYVLAALIIAGLGFFAQHSTEQVGQPTIVNNYALTAFLTTGFVSGMLYWLFSGRLAGGRMPEPLKPAVQPSLAKAGPAPTPAAKATPATATPKPQPKDNAAEVGASPASAPKKA